MRVEPEARSHVGSDKREYERFPGGRGSVLDLGMAREVGFNTNGET